MFSHRVQYSTEGKLKEPNLAAEAGQGLLKAVTSYAKGDMGGVFKSAMGLVKTAAGGSQKADKLAKATKTSPADVVSTYTWTLVMLLLTRTLDFFQWLQRQPDEC